VADEYQDEEDEPNVKSQLALGALACLLLSMGLGLLPDSALPSLYRTIMWLFFAMMALLCFYMAFPHMWGYSLWLGGIYGLSVLGILFLLGRGEKLNLSYGFAAAMGVLLELGALSLVYGMLIRIRLARATLGVRVPLGLWLLGIVMFFLFSNAAGGIWATWAVGGSGASLAGYAFLELMVAGLAVYACWAPESLWTAGHAHGEMLDVKPEDSLPGAALLKRIVGKKEELPAKCPACGGSLKTVQLKCPSCGEANPAGWCASSEIYAAPCPSCGATITVGDKKCAKCGTALNGLTCSHCKKASSLRNWDRAKA
jgi:predicted RNA-binding Zn-ribbon protein involved in translation (DUF1610 family)